MMAVADYYQNSSSWLACLGRRIGRRGAFLLLFGIGYIFIGLGQSYTISPPATIYGLQYLLHIMSLFHWGGVWMAAGMVAMVMSLSSTPRHDWVGFVCLAVMPSLWGGAFYATWLIHDFGRAGLQAVIWTILGLAVALVAGWPEAPRKGEITAKLAKVGL